MKALFTEEREPAEDEEAPRALQRQDAVPNPGAEERQEQFPPAWENWSPGRSSGPAWTSCLCC